MLIILFVSILFLFLYLISLASGWFAILELHKMKNTPMMTLLNKKEIVSLFIPICNTIVAFGFLIILLCESARESINDKFGSNRERS